MDQQLARAEGRRVEQVLLLSDEIALMVRILSAADIDVLSSAVDRKSVVCGKSRAITSSEILKGTKTLSCDLCRAFAVPTRACSGLRIALKSTALLLLGKSLAALASWLDGASQVSAVRRTPKVSSEECMPAPNATSSSGSSCFSATTRKHSYICLLASSEAYWLSRGARQAACYRGSAQQTSLGVGLKS